MKQPRKSNGRYSHKGVNLLNWRIWVIVATLVFCLLASHYGNLDSTYVVEKVESPLVVYMTATVVGHPQDESVETKIRRYFPRSHKTIIAIAKAESRMNPNAVGYNCYYYKGKATTTKIVGGSKACDIPDRHLAWSRDCGILQINTTAQSCPKETIDEHLKRAANLSRVQGLNAWVTHWNGDYKDHLASN
jgi:hypothetical protein